MALWLLNPDDEAIFRKTGFSLIKPIRFNNVICDRRTIDLFIPSIVIFALNVSISNNLIVFHAIVYSSKKRMLNEYGLVIRKKNVKLRSFLRVTDTIKHKHIIYEYMFKENKLKSKRFIIYAFVLSALFQNDTFLLR